MGFHGYGAYLTSCLVESGMLLVLVASLAVLWAIWIGFVL